MIETMPTYLGQQFYPNGLPLPAHRIKVNGKSVVELFLKTAEDSEENKEAEDILDNYYRYYLLAPCWCLDGITEEEIMSANGDKLFEICMELGLDPL